jgi:histidinol dehydrogenase
VRTGGDAAVIEFTRRFDGHAPEPGALRIEADEIDRAVAGLHGEAVDALSLARDRIEAHHRAQIPTDHDQTDALGVRLGWRWRAIEAVGLYVPGGTASYPSSVLMNAVPAKVAGVERVVMVVPTPNGNLNPLVLAAARLAGVDEIYRIGGAQAVAALAYGTETIRPVSKIVGPGNAYVAAAKRRVFGQVGIDMIAGPSEVLILADASADPEWVAADLLAQAEHDTAAQAILITSSAELADRVAAAVEAQLATLPRRDIAAASWRDHGAIITLGSLEDAVPLVDLIAPEHLEIEAEGAERLAGLVRNAGAIFLGAYTPEALGDYVAGSNHVLPTARSARFASGLGVLDFMKRTAILDCSREALARIGPAAVALGRAEGLEGHARSVLMRLDRA